MPRSADQLLAEAAALPLLDAAYAIWRQKIWFERLEGRVWPKRDLSTPEAVEKSVAEINAQLKYEHDFAQAGPTFDRLRRAHPNATDHELKQAIVAAVKFDDDCFKYFAYGSGRGLLGHVRARRGTRGSRQSALSGDDLSRCPQPCGLLHEVSAL